MFDVVYADVVLAARRLERLADASAAAVDASHGTLTMALLTYR